MTIRVIGVILLLHTCGINERKGSMAQKLTITISDDLHTRLEKVRDEMNISAVCQAAILSEVEIKELLKKGGKGMDALKTRLRAEKQDALKGYIDLGRKAGIVDARQLSLEDFQAIEKIYNLFDNDQYEFTVSDLRKLDAWECIKERLDEQSEDTHTNYARGWVEGVMDVWDEVKDEI